MQYISGDCMTPGRWCWSEQLYHPPYVPQQGLEPGLRALPASAKQKKNGKPQLCCIQYGLNVWDLIIVLVGLQGLNRVLPNLLLSSALSKLTSPANTGCHSTGWVLNTCLCFGKWTSLPSQGWRMSCISSGRQNPICWLLLGCTT